MRFWLLQVPIFLVAWCLSVPAAWMMVTAEWMLDKAEWFLDAAEKAGE